MHIYTYTCMTIHTNTHIYLYTHMCVHACVLDACREGLRPVHWTFAPGAWAVLLPWKLTDLFLSVGLLLAARYTRRRRGGYYYPEL